MMLKNLMEEKQLNFNQPLLSVRRFSATVVSSEADEKRKAEKSLPKLPPLPVYKSELKSGPVRNPGTVPFVWEQIPGRPKDERKSPNQALEWLPTAPKLPPGRVSKVKKQATDKGSECTTAAQSPTGNVLSNSQNVSTLDTKEVTKYDSSKVEMEDKGIAGSDDGDETYLDALSRSESFFMNCSISGLSGLDGLDIKPSGTFSTDPQTRDFMMGRFLPAAKALASETPQYASRKQPVAREQPLLQEQPSGMKKVVSGDKQHPLNQHRPKDLPHYVQDIAGDKSMRVQAQLPISSVRRVRAKSSYAISYREAKKEHSLGDSSEKRLMSGHPEGRVPEDKNDLIHESNQITNRSDCQKLDGSPMYRRLQGSGISPYRNECSQHEEKGFLGIPEKAKNSREANSSGKYRKCHNNFQELLAAENVAELEMGPGSPVVEKTLYIDSVQTVKSPCSSDTKGRIIDYRGNGFEIREKRDKVEEITHSVESSFQDTEHLGDGNEKAIVRHKSLEFPDSSFLSSSGRSSDDVQTDIRIGYIPNQDLIQHSSQVTSSKGADQEKLNLESKQLVKSGDRENFVGLTPDCSTLTSTKLAGEKKIGLESQQSRQSGREDSSHGHVQNSVSLTNSKLANRGKIDLESHRLLKLGNQESPRGNKVPLPLGPPLPKSPSESWLKRTLPSISSRSSSSQSSLGSRSYTSSQASKTSSLDPKWETIVKTSKPHHGHLRFSEELLTPIPEA
ncbi:hypothetical protein PRUPE_3G117500 [Prunus persica]|uniref:Uncharacterized protein n=1 Tax=Prunus persica TaxID=3760 RepID=A0A251PYS3_PRUPE|nr:hypothetical protein PRUPE_3G117500 [Prunus persica]